MLKVLSAAATLSATIAVSGCQRVPSPGDSATMESKQPYKRVTLSPWRLRYFEGDNVISLSAEMGSDEQGSYYIVYVPGSKTWLRKMPDWARNRRDEILVDIRQLTAHERIKWVDE
jgi:hypothetical protein